MTQISQFLCDDVIIHISSFLNCTDYFSLRSVNSQFFSSLSFKRFDETLIRKWKNIEEKLEKSFKIHDIEQFNQTSTTKTTFFHDLGLIIHCEYLGLINHCEYSWPSFNSFEIYCKTFNNKVFKLYESDPNYKNAPYSIYLIEPGIIRVLNDYQEVQINFASDTIEISCCQLDGTFYQKRDSDEGIWLFYKDKQIRVHKQSFAVFRKKPENGFYVFQNFLSLNQHLKFFAQFGRWVLFKGEDVDKMILFDFDELDLYWFRRHAHDSFDPNLLTFIHFESTNSIGIIDSKFLKIYDRKSRGAWSLSKELILPSNSNRYGYCEIEQRFVKFGSFERCVT